LVGTCEIIFDFPCVLVETMQLIAGVKEVFCDQATHKVSVMLREGREYNYRMATLIEYARQEDPYKLPPKRWEDRPK
jgi:hypothetical protein